MIIVTLVMEQQLIAPLVTWHQLE